MITRTGCTVPGCRNTLNPLHQCDLCGATICNEHGGYHAEITHPSRSYR